jgi:cell division protein FtsB
MRVDGTIVGQAKEIVSMQCLPILIGFLIAVLPMGAALATDSAKSVTDSHAVAEVENLEGKEKTKEKEKANDQLKDDQAKTAAQIDADKATVEEILTRESKKEDYTDLERCIPTRNIRSVEVIDEKHVSFQVSRSEYYLVQLKHRCPGLRRGKPILYEPTSHRLCALDGIRGIYDHGLGGATPGMRCAITGFQSVTKEQLVMLKDALKAERRKPKRS